VLFGVYGRREREMCGQNGKKDMKKKQRKKNRVVELHARKRKKDYFSLCTKMMLFWYFTLFCFFK
jgi:hypothetical protein